MASLHELSDPILKDQLKELRIPLQNLQGNILQGHGRDHSVHVFLRFEDGKQTDVKQWIKELAKDITSAQQQLNEAEQYRLYSIPGHLFMSFFLSAKGYTYLGLNFPKNYPTFDDEAFPSGMKKAQGRLNDLTPEKWEEGYRQDIHATVLLADDNEPFLLRETRKLLDSVKAHAQICAVEHGRVMRNSQGERVEHFGYVDSLSQPLFFESDIERKSQNGGTRVWKPDAGPSLVLVPDPYGRKETDRHGWVKKYSDSGSYLVFRKLEQRVRAFKTHQADLAQALNPAGADEKRAAAFVMGRFEDGTPIVLQDTAGHPSPVPNSFTYDDDLAGRKCPLQAHIRKVNPRDKENEARRHRIVRRGIPYGKRQKEPKDNPRLDELPEDDVGLLFMCYQRNIKEHFEFLLREWASDPDIPHKGTGIDPIIGQPGSKGVGQQKWPVHWGGADETPKGFPFHGFVTLKGGEYFFAPSIYFLSNIDTRENAG
jgi:Dyp-type peroxidase family